MTRPRGAALALLLAACSAPPPPHAAAAERAATRALAFVWSQQTADGRVPSATYGVLRPGWTLTATALAATARFPARLRAPHAAAIARAFACLATAIDSDGAVGLDGAAIDYPTYTTAHWLSALSRLQPDGWQPLAQRLVARLRAVQFDEALGWRTDDAFYGAFGFGVRRERAPAGSGLVDIAVQRTVLEALRTAGVPSSDPVCVRALAFVRRCQLADGSFVFTPGPDFRRSKAVDGKHGYGTTTADGLRALRACGLGDDDDGVRRARTWLTAHRAVLPVPGLPLATAPPIEPALRFYWWSTFADLDLAPPLHGDLLRELLARQRQGGAFVGDSDRMKEDDPLVASCLALFALAPMLER